MFLFNIIGWTCVNKSRRLQKRIAQERVKTLFLNAINYSSSNPEVSRQQLEIIKRILLKFNIRLAYPYKIFFCRKCKSPLLPGMDSKIRIVNKPKLHVKILCLKCGNVYRKFIV